MKKIVSLFIVLTMIACMGLTSYAADGVHYALTVDKAELEVGSGVQEVLVTMNIVVDTDVTVSSAQTGFNFGGLAIVSGSYNDSALTALIPRGDMLDEAKGAYTYMDMVNWSTPALAAGTVIPVTAKVTVDTTAEAVYTIALDGVDMLADDYATSVVNDSSAKATITVKAAGPKTEPKVEKLNAKRDLTVDNTTWKDLAIYEANFVLADIVATEDYGITDGTNKLNVAVAGEGTTNFVLAFYGVSDAELATMNISSYCTVPVVEK